MKQRLGALLYEPVLGSLLGSLRRCVVSLALSLRPPLHEGVLDCCCGAGGLLLMLNNSMSSVSKKRALCIGIDLSPAMLRQAKKRTASTPTSLVRCDGSKLPFADKSFGLVTLCMALHTVPYDVALRMTQESRRVAQHVIIADYCLVERNIYAPAAVLATSLEMLAGGSHYRNYKVFMQRGGLEGFLYKAGWSVRQRHTVLGGVGRVVLL